jgi:class 3 adenylate cyclase
VSDSAATSTGTAERRQVTALFADMVGFTAISERLGEEGTFALIQPIYELMAAAVGEQGGSVKSFTGDGIMALFGVPNALEDAPLRACRAGFLIQERLAAAAEAIEAKHGVRPQMRIGVNSGLAIVTHIHGAADSATALGDTVNLASRLQTLAEPGAVYLSEATLRLVGGLVETSFAGAHAIKGKAEPQRVYRLEAIRRGAARFDAALGRGLSAYVGRDREMEILELAFAAARENLRVVDIVAEPGMGKSRLAHEFLQRIANERAFVLIGNSSPDGQQTPFLPFIEVVRGAFQVRAGEAEDEIARKLMSGLNLLGLHTIENVGLLLNLLGLKPPEGALVGLDGVLIGLRTRDLLQALLAARCRLTPVVLLLEDLHWIDSVSQEVLGTIVANEANLRLLILHTRRPEFLPPWREASVVTALNLAPLPAGDIRRLAETRLGVESLPENLTRQLIDKAEGNALFAEEILSFLTERGVLRIVEGKVEFDSGAVASALPASVQSLLTARVDRLTPRDRALLQAAAVIGRRFDPLLLAVVVDDTGEIEVRLAAMQGLDLVRPESGGDCAFKHALVRDALYQSLLTGPRAALHLKIAEEIERRAGNRLPEVVETLAHHFGQTDREDKAFKYLAMAGAKSNGVYSLDEAQRHFADAIEVLERTPDCASDMQIAALLADFTLCSNLSMRMTLLTETVARFLPRLLRLGDVPERVLVNHHYVGALLQLGRFQEARQAQIDLTSIGSRLGDPRSLAYDLSNAMFVSAIVAPTSIDTSERQARELLAAAAATDDPYIQVFSLFVVAWDELHRGRLVKAREWAQELIDLGQRLNDPRSLGFGLNVQAWIALLGDNYPLALNLAEASNDVARVNFDKESIKNIMKTVAVLLRQPGAHQALQDWMHECAANNWDYYAVSLDPVWGVSLVLRGDIRGGIRWMEKTILKRESEGYGLAADWSRLFLCEIYLEIVSSKERPSASVLARNAFALVIVTLTAEKQIVGLIDRVRQNLQLDPNGHFIARCEMILGLLYKAKKKRVLAEMHLTEAKRIVSQLGRTPMLTKIETALLELVG